MNTKLRNRLVKRYGEAKVRYLEMTFRPPKIQAEVKLPRVREKRISPSVIRRRHVKGGTPTP